MNKKLKAIIAVVLVSIIVFMVSMPFGAIQVTRLYGDINNDSFVTIQDARIALMIATGIYPETVEGLDFQTTDIDSNGKINLDDVLTILKTAAGFIPTKPIGNFEFTENGAEFTNLVNTYRVQADFAKSYVTYSEDLSNIARIAAEEYATKTGTAFTNFDGSYYYKYLDYAGISYEYADKIVISSSYSHKAAVEAMMRNQQSKKALLSDEFTKIGVGAYTKDARTFYWCVILIKD